MNDAAPITTPILNERVGVPTFLVDVAKEPTAPDLRMQPGADDRPISASENLFPGFAKNYPANNFEPIPDTVATALQENSAREANKLARTLGSYMAAARESAGKMPAPSIVARLRKLAGHMKEAERVVPPPIVAQPHDPSHVLDRLFGDPAAAEPAADPVRELLAPVNLEVGTLRQRLDHLERGAAEAEIDRRLAKLTPEYAAAHGAELTAAGLPEYTPPAGQTLAHTLRNPAIGLTSWLGAQFMPEGPMKRIAQHLPVVQAGLNLTGLTKAEPGRYKRWREDVRDTLRTQHGLEG